jgi:uncharacterized delta-60 repeat protein
MPVDRRRRGSGRSWRTACIATAVLVLPLAPPAGAAPGDLDPRFGDGGLVQTELGGTGDFANAAVLQPDGKVVVVGTAGEPFAGDFTVARYLRDGRLDPSFGAGGVATTDFGRSEEAAWGVALQPDGRIVAVGTAGNMADDEDDFAIARYLQDGTPDASFGGDGMVTTDFGGRFDLATSVVVQPDSTLVVAGFGSRRNGRGSGFALARYRPDGALDPAFGNDGRVITWFADFGGAGIATLLRQSDGRLVAAGRGAYFADGTIEFAVARYLPDGRPDPSFSRDGIVRDDFGGFGAEAAALQDHGRVVVAGQAVGSRHVEFVVARYTPDGRRDAAFGAGNGVVRTDLGGYDGAFALTVQPDRRIVAGGQGGDPTGGGGLALARYEPDGDLDPSFGTAGKVVTGMGNDSGLARAILVTSDGDLVAVGTHVDDRGADWQLARYDGCCAEAAP